MAERTPDPPREDPGRSPPLPLSDRTLASLATHAPDAILAADLEGRVFWWNRAAAALFGLGGGAASGEHLADLLAARNREKRVRLLLARVRSQGFLRRRRVRCRRRGEGAFETEWTLALVRDEDGAAEAAVVIARDVTAQRRLEVEQRFLQEVSRQLMGSLEYDQTLDSLARLAVPFFCDWCIVDLEGDGDGLRRVAVAHADPACREPAEQLRQRFPPRADALQPGAQALARGEPVLVTANQAVELLANTEPPEHRQLLLALGVHSALAVPLLARGRVIGALTFVTGSSGRPFGPREVALAEEVARRAALAIDNARLFQQAQDAVGAREEIAAIVSHDLRDPLHAATLSASLLMRPELSPEQHRRHQEIIHRSLQRMDRLIADLLDVTRVEAGRLAVEQRPLDLGPLLQETCETVQPLAEAKGVRLECGDWQGLPTVLGDPHRLAQALANLLSNAIKHGPEGGTVWLTAEEEGGEVRIGVRDQGPGIASEELPRIFDRYWQARRGDSRGVGLGLAITKGIVEAHGGRIWVESQPGAGSAFYFTVPVAHERGGSAALGSAE
jgi:PAS domain S-box-containing protein